MTPFSGTIPSITAQSQDIDANGTPWAMDRGEGWSHQLSIELFGPDYIPRQFLDPQNLFEGYVEGVLPRITSWNAVFRVVPKNATLQTQFINLGFNTAIFPEGIIAKISPWQNLQSCYHLSGRISLFTISPSTKPLTFWGVKWEGGVTRRWSCETPRGLNLPLGAVLF